MLLFVTYVMKKFILTLLLLLFPLTKLGSKEIIDLGECKSGKLSSLGFEKLMEKLKDASKFYTSVEQVDLEDVNRWLDKSKSIQWDYKNIVKRKGELIRIK